MVIGILIGVSGMSDMGGAIGGAPPANVAMRDTAGRYLLDTAGRDMRDTTGS